ncbi:hypothetical protein ANN_21997 [Periplaneta americana]|uniref:Uncharacterized protein n=1 Tax=Periplaneta americana TaxID=6978 RepID=A0ABQ8S6X7_PERAM|nr:hypothetical protein ANN_21997 [Periplaneta americana]
MFLIVSYYSIVLFADTDCTDVSAFEWLSQLRFYWDRDIDDCTVRQTNTYFVYGYEYLGNSGRLVITPLTDRCYITLTTALHLHRGGSPKGPAGTGKTETVKDLGKGLGMYVIVVNCSEGLDFKSMGRMFSGLAQTGAWACFDEFNRINIEVLSVVAQQILSILSALATKAKRFIFEGQELNLVLTCGIFITMNPGYAGRTELPDNLKSMFRPISMIVPDSALIAEIVLFGEGFRDTRVLAKKVYTLYSLATQQLSKQDHYDFGLRGMVALLRYAGRKRRQFPTLPDDEIVLLAMKDMNVAKLTSDDLPLFNGITSDLFPGVDAPVIDYEDLAVAVEAEFLAQGLQAYYLQTCVILYSSDITLSLQVSLLFEVDDLSQASPATVSRCGMVYSDYKDLGWRPYVDSWLQRMQERGELYVKTMKEYFDRYVNAILQFKRLNCQETVPVPELRSVISLCKLLECLAVKENGLDASDESLFENMSKMWFLFCLVWSVCASVDENGRKKLDNIIREMESIFPIKDTVYEYFVDVSSKSLVLWELKLSDTWKYNKELPFFKITVPTVDTVRYQYLVSTLLYNQYECLLVGPVGTGKTMITFMDDLNMPAKEIYGAQPPLELIRQWIDYGFWYDRQKQTLTYVKILYNISTSVTQIYLFSFPQDMLLLAAMGPPGGGRNQISDRLLTKFIVINMTFPSEAQITRIFGTLLIQHVADFDEEVKMIAKTITAASIDLYYAVIAKMLPTPTKIHYLFNLRDISKVNKTDICFRNRIRQYPALVNCTTIDWFKDWPKEALLEVANKYLADVNFLETIGDKKITLGEFEYAAAQEKLRTSVALIFATIHDSVSKYSRKMLTELKRHNYVTPINYLELVAGYKQ